MSCRISVHVAAVAGLLDGDRCERAARLARFAADAGVDGVVVALRAGAEESTSRELRSLRAVSPLAVKLLVPIQGALVEQALRLRPQTIALAPDPGGEGSSVDPSHALRQRMTVTSAIVDRARQQGIAIASWLPPERAEVEMAALLGVDQIVFDAEGRVAGRARAALSTSRDGLRRAAVRAHELGLEIGLHGGISIDNAAAVERLGVIAELEVGHAFASDASRLGLAEALRQLRRATG